MCSALDPVSVLFVQEAASKNFVLKVYLGCVVALTHPTHNYEACPAPPVPKMPALGEWGLLTPVAC